MKLFKAIAATACALAVASAAQATEYKDSSANYPGGEEGLSWETGANGGEGFGAWTIKSTTGTDGWAGSGIWNPSANDFQGTWKGKTTAFGMIGKGAGYSVKASRAFRAALAPGDSFQLDMGVNWDANIDDAHKGFVLTAGGKAVIEINHGNFPGHIYVNGDDSFDVWNEAPNPEEGEVLYPMTWKFTAKDSTTLTVSANSRKDASKVFEQDFELATSAVDGFILQSVEQDNQNEDRRQSYYDNFVLEIAGELPELVDLKFTDGEWAVSNASQTLSFKLSRSSAVGALDVAIDSSYEEFVPPTTVSFADGESEVEFQVEATLVGSFNTATLTASATGCNPDTYDVKGPCYLLSVDAGDTFQGDEKNFWMNWEDNGIPLDESKITIESDPADALTLPSSWTWNMEEGGAYVASSLTANSSGTLVVKYDGVKMADWFIDVAKLGFTISGPTAAKTGSSHEYKLSGVFPDDYEKATVSVVKGDATLDPADGKLTVYRSDDPAATFTVNFGDTAEPVTLSVKGNYPADPFVIDVTAPVDPSIFDGYVAYDDASLYEDGFDYAAVGAGSDKFQPWQNDYIDSDGETKFAGATMVTSAPDEAALSDGAAFAIYANGADGAEIKLLRPFVNALAPGQAFSLQVSPNYRDGEKSVRISGAYEGVWYDRVVFSFDNDGYYYSIDYGENVSLGWEYGTKAIAISLQYAADGSSYTLSFAREGDETVTVENFTLPGSVDGVIFRSRNGGNGAENNVVFNRLAIEQVEKPIVIRSIGWGEGTYSPEGDGTYTITLTATTDDIGEVAISVDPAEGALSLASAIVDLTGVTSGTITYTLEGAKKDDTFHISAIPVDTTVAALEGEGAYEVKVIDPYLTLWCNDGGEFTTDTKEIWLSLSASPSRYGTYTLQSSDPSVLELSVDSVTIPDGEGNGTAWFNVFVKGTGFSTISVVEDEAANWNFTITQGTEVEIPAPAPVKGKGLSWKASDLAGFTLRGTATLGDPPTADSWSDLVEGVDYETDGENITVLYTSAYNYIAIVAK